MTVAVGSSADESKMDSDYAKLDGEKENVEVKTNISKDTTNKNVNNIDMNEKNVLQSVENRLDTMPKSSDKEHEISSNDDGYCSLPTDLNCEFESENSSDSVTNKKDDVVNKDNIKACTKETDNESATNKSENEESNSQTSCKETDNILKCLGDPESDIEDGNDDKGVDSDTDGINEKDNLSDSDDDDIVTINESLKRADDVLKSLGDPESDSDDDSNNVKSDSNVNNGDDNSSDDGDDREKREDIQRQDDSGVSDQSDEEMKPAKKYPKERKAARISKTMMKETKSEQQRLKRERRVQIPYHTPSNKGIKDFLQRVPQLKKTPIESRSVGKLPQEKSSFEKLFDAKPRLSLPNDFVVDFGEEEEKEEKPVKGLDLFMKRFKKHTDFKKTPEVKAKVQKEQISEKTPGSARTFFKDKLKQDILKKRHEVCIDLEAQKQFYDEENYADEEEIEFEESDDGGDSEDSSDNEQGKNDDDNPQDKTAEEVPENEAEMFNHASDLAEKQEIDEEITDFHIETQPQNTWEDSSSNVSSVLHAAQGEPSNRQIQPCHIQLTPFTKLLKSGLLDSAMKESLSKENFEEPSLTLPNEDTQDLFRESEAREEEAESCNLPAEGFHLSLDEETQFGPVLNSQGLFQEPSKKKPEMAKKLFDMDLGNDQVSMTQVLGFCSGQFTKDPGSGDEMEAPFASHIDDDIVNTNSQSNFPTEVESSSKVPVEKDDKAEKLFFLASDNEETTDKDFGEEVNVLEKDDDTKDDGGEEEDSRQGGEQNDDQSDEEEESDGEQEELSDTEDLIHDGEERGSKKDKPAGPLKKKMFYEEEAELSGSDVGSDDENLGSDYDEYEIDIEAENEHTSTSKLKKQVHKIHQRKMLDKDTKEIRLLQELYMEDGDLGGGVKRKRNFRWYTRNEFDSFNGGQSDGSDDENVDDMTIQNRKDRLERDNFLQEMQEKEEPHVVLDECSQSVLERISHNKKPATEWKTTYASSQAKKFKRSGSFLAGKIPNSDVVNLPSAANNQRSGKSKFVFKATDAPKNKSKEEEKKPSKASSKITQPAKKVPRLDRSSKSVFNLM